MTLSLDPDPPMRWAALVTAPTDPFGVEPAGRADRAHGALLGLGLGDALGMPTQLLPRALVRERWGRIDRFYPAPDDNPVSRGTPAGRVTDDTDQAVIVGELLVAGGGLVDPAELGRRLLAWHASMQAQGSLDLLGPSTMRAVQALAAGTPVEQTGRWGDTNGAAMRVAPVGIACPPAPLETLVAAVADVDRLTHDTQIANAGAGAIAAAVSAGIDGASVEQALDLAMAAAEAGAEHGHATAGADVAARIAWALDLVRARLGDSVGDSVADSAAGGRADGEDVREEVLDTVARLVGTGVATQEAVPAACAVALLYADDPWGGVCAAAALGGDCDTIAAMVGAILGATHGAGAFPVEAVRELAAANPELHLDRLAQQLLTLRDRAADQPLPQRLTKPLAQPADQPPEQPARLVLVGSVIVDLMTEVPHLPTKGADVLAGPLVAQAGGGYNVLVAAHRLGLAVALAGRVGSGPMGSRIRAALAEIGAEVLVEVADVMVRKVYQPTDSGSCVGFVEPDGERTFVTSPGVESLLRPTDLGAVDVRATDWVYLSGYDLLYPVSGPTIADWLDRVAPTHLVLDPGPLVDQIDPDLLDRVLRRTTVLTANARELALLADRTPDDPDQPLLARLAGAERPLRQAMVIARDGARGAWLHRATSSVGGADATHHAPVPPVEAVDTTGAGDTHTGALIALLAQGLPAEVAVDRAGLAAAWSVTRRGSATAPTSAELAAFAQVAGSPATAPQRGSTQPAPRTHHEREDGHR